MVNNMRANNRPCILTVDDDRLLLAVLELGMKNAGYDILQAASGEEALEVIARRTPDLAILDISMPGMSGITLAKHLRRETTIPFMFFSSHEGIDVVRQATQNGAIGYLVKPMIITHIIPAIETGLTRAQEIKQMRRTSADLTAALVARRQAGELMRGELEQLVMRHTTELARLNHRLDQAQRHIIESRAYTDELSRLANEDALTALPNRNWLMRFLPEALERARNSGFMVALLYLDLDGFKNVNDTSGHPAGDELLCAAALRMRSALKPTDTIARHGGDEFIIVIEQVVCESDAAHVAQRMGEVLKNPFELSSGKNAVGASIGISLYPRDGENTEALLKKSDLALYHAKSEGKGRYRFYAPGFSR